MFEDFLTGANSEEKSHSDCERKTMKTNREMKPIRSSVVVKVISDVLIWLKLFPVICGLPVKLYKMEEKRQHAPSTDHRHAYRLYTEVEEASERPRVQTENASEDHEEEPGKSLEKRQPYQLQQEV